MMCIWLSSLFVPNCWAWFSTFSMGSSRPNSVSTRQIYTYMYLPVISMVVTE